MIKINKKLEYSFMILKAFTQEPQGAQLSAKMLSETLHIPVDTTAKVLQILTKENILESHQGTRGGYILAKPLIDINLYDLATGVQGSFMDLACQSGECSVEHHCNIASPIKTFSGKLKGFFEQTTMEEILQG